MQPIWIWIGLEMTTRILCVVQCWYLAIVIWSVRKFESWQPDSRQ